MINYYDILGLQNGAGVSEVKAAFRQLAKLYHPDVNPQGKEQFTRILKAYEVLSDPHLKYSYDYKLNAYREGLARQAENASPKNKNWRFDDRELKRRQYYNEHIKKYEKKNNPEATEPLPKSNYNEFKYILFATPLAVILFLAIMSISTNNKELKKAPHQRSAPIKKTSDLKMGDAPYDSYFGPSYYGAQDTARLIVKNLNSNDVVVCLFRGDTFLRSFFLLASYSAEVPQLPVDALSIRYCSGKYYNNELRVPGVNVKGGFSESALFFESTYPVRLNSINELTLLDQKTEGFSMINASRFFRKE